MSCLFDFTDRVIVVTGGAGGIGAALARRCAAAGAIVVVLDRDERAGRALAGGGHAPGTIEHVTVDVTDRAGVHGAIGDIAARHERIDGLVCAAIVQPLVDAVDLDPATWRTAMDVNVAGVVWACQAALPAMIAQRSGSIVLFVSGVSELGKAGSSPYTASKGAVGGFAKTLAREVADHGIRVNTCRPGGVDTPMTRATNPSAATLDRPEEVVGPLMFLLSDEATMTGSSVSREMLYRPVAAARAEVVA